MSKINIKSKSELSLNWKNEAKTVPYNSAIKIMEQTVKDIYISKLSRSSATNLQTNHNALKDKIKDASVEIQPKQSKN